MSADTTPISPARFAAALKTLSTSTLHLKLLEIGNSIAHLEYSNDQLKPFAEGRAPILRSGGDDAAQDQDHDDGNDDPVIEDGPAGEPDEDCIQAIEENERVIERMFERVGLIKLEVQERGLSFEEFIGIASPEWQGGEHFYGEEGETMGDELQEEQTRTRTRTTESDPLSSFISETSSPWTDGSIITGTIRNGHVHVDNEAGRPAEGGGGGRGGGGTTQGGGGSLSDEQLREALERQVGNLDPNAENEENDDDDRRDGGLYI